ncbi:hypothetical protein MTR67_044768 [Solanum verrucosum]|uniref:NmrA-like domain-containing protein n=1 Tax=Solanum verrucosum TaxID=315347 RepID=A0AAF0UR34_SOLVR|nr:hypothetical protein MTR67_044768 [Solanum verrucosum]
MAGKSKILFIGGTGYIGKFIVEASAKAGHHTFVFVRESTLSDPTKTKLIDTFKSFGVTFLHGDLYDHESLVKAIKQVDVVISTVGHALLADQVKIIAAIKEAGNVKRFFPSEFGNDVDRVHAVEPAKTTYNTKAQFRRIVEAEGIPFTYVVNFFFAGYFLPNLAQSGPVGPPKDKVVILGDGNTKAVFNKEEDIGTYTIKAVDDPKTLNKFLYIKPPHNIITLNELVSLWEKKTGKNLERIYVPEEQVLKNIQEASVPLNVLLSICHAAFVKGDHTNFEIDSSFGVEASEVYPDVKYTPVDEILNQFWRSISSSRLVLFVSACTTVDSLSIMGLFRYFSVLASAFTSHFYVDFAILGVMLCHEVSLGSLVALSTVSRLGVVSGRDSSILKTFVITYVLVTWRSFYCEFLG